MNLTRFLFGAFLIGALASSPAFGQAQRTFVSGSGSDSNPCSRAAPCRNLSQAILQTVAGGEVVVLDSAGYGPVSINKSISITAPPGVYAGISVFSGDGIDISAGPSDTILLRGLSVNNQGSTGSGIVFNGGLSLHIESCIVSGFAGSTGAAGLALAGAGDLELKDSIVKGNSMGILVRPATGAAMAAIDGVRLYANGTGLQVGDNSNATILNSTVAHNTGIGLHALSSGAGPVKLNIDGCVVSGNGGSGIVAESDSTGVAIIRVSDSAVTDNLVGFNNIGAPAVFLSLGNNTVEGNTVLNTNGAIGSFTSK